MTFETDDNYSIRNEKQYSHRTDLLPVLIQPSSVLRQPFHIINNKGRARNLITCCSTEYWTTSVQSALDRRTWSNLWNSHKSPMRWTKSYACRVEAIQTSKPVRSSTHKVSSTLDILWWRVTGRYVLTDRMQKQSNTDNWIMSHISFHQSAHCIQNRVQVCQKHIPPGSPGTGSKGRPSRLSLLSRVIACRPCDLPHFTFSRWPLMISLLNDFSAAASAAARVVYWTNAHCCRGTTVRLRISPYW